jgi:tripartite ATP-independent transporter DctP family solute receptor
MMLKKFRCLALVMVLILVFVNCTTFAAVKKPIKLVFGHVFPAEHFFVKSDHYFKELVEKNSKGKILIDYYPASQLGGGPEMMQATRSGAQQLDILSPEDLAQYWQKIGTLGLPYLFRDQAHHIKVAQRLTSLINQDELAAKTGMRVLSVRIRAPRQLTTKFPVNKLDDIKGIKIRVPGTPLMVALWKAFGTIPTSMSAEDIYTALATGVIDAQENPLPDIYTRKLYEQVKYCALTGHKRDLAMLVINEKCWRSLAAKQRKIIKNAAVKSAKMGCKDAIENENKYYKLLVKAGMKFTKPDVNPFMEKAKTVWSQFGDKGMLEKVEAIK